MKPRIYEVPGDNRDVSDERSKLYRLLIILKDAGVLELPLSCLYEDCARAGIRLSHSGIVSILRSWQVPRGSYKENILIAKFE